MRSSLSISNGAGHAGRLRLAAVLLITGFLASCAIVVPDSALPHIVAVDSDGNFIPIRSNTPFSDRDGFRHQQNLLDNPNLEPAYAAHLDRVFTAIQNSGKKKILVYVHGGLNEFSTSLRRAARDAPKILDAGAFPIFVNWHSEAINTYGEQLVSIREGRKPAWRHLAVPFYFLADVGRVVVEAPKSWFTRFAKLWEGAKDQSSNGELPPGLVVRESSDDDAEPSRFWGVVRWIATSPVKFATTPVADTLGDAAWQNMLRRTMILFDKPSEFENREADLTAFDREHSAKRGSGAFGVLLHHLEEFVARHPSEYELTFIGHSMGCIVLSEALRRMASNPNPPAADIVYMGAACTIRDFLDDVVPYLRKQKEASFYNLCLHPNAENREEVWGGTVPNGTLLVWVDTMYATPWIHLDRTFGRWQNTRGAAHLIPEDVRDRIRFKVFAYGSDEPQTHGGFDQFAYWTHEYWWE